MNWLKYGPIILTLLTGFLFVIGFTYEYEYYEWFGIDVNALNLPVYAFLFASLHPILGWISNAFGKLLYPMLVPLLVLASLARFLKLATARALIWRAWLWVHRLHRRWLGRSFGKPGPTHQAPEKYYRDRRWFWRLDEQNNSRATRIPRLLKSAFRANLTLIGIIVVFALSGNDAATQGRKDAERDFKQPSVETSLTFKKDEIQRRVAIFKASKE
jgi:hypothetical protein